jgi:hypothetical protein
MPLFLTPNQEWAAEQIIDRMDRDDIDPKNKITRKDIRAMNAALNKLDSILDQSWAKLLTLDELREVFEDIILEKNIKV